MHLGKATQWHFHAPYCQHSLFKDSQNNYHPIFSFNVNSNRGHNTSKSLLRFSGDVRAVRFDGGNGDYSGRISAPDYNYYCGSSSSSDHALIPLNE
jgi:hypothetical protein